MEDILSQISENASVPRQNALKKACKETLELLKDETVSAAAEPYQLRERCLHPLQLALESRSSRLAGYAIGGIQLLLTDERFQSSLESEDEDKWLPMQVLNCVWATPNLSDEIQVEVMKVMLNMTFSTAWCMNAKVITKIAELCFSTFLSTTKQNLREAIITTLTRILGLFYQRQIMQQKTFPNPAINKVALDTYAASQGSVRTAVKATLTQLLSTISEKLKEKEAVKAEDCDSAIAEFSSQVEGGEIDSLEKDVIAILKYLCDKLTSSPSSNHTRQMVPLLLDGIHSILYNVPTNIRNNSEFLDIVWQKLCPSLVSLLGNPLTDKNVTSQKAGSNEEMGRGSGCSSSAPNNLTNASAKTIYNIVVELVRLVGNLRSLRPVLESVFHRMLLYPPPVHRQDALKAIREVLNQADHLLNLAGPTMCDEKSLVQGSRNKKHHHDLALLKLILDSIQESAQCNDSTVCITSVDLISDLLTSLEQVAKGQGVSDDMVQEINSQYRELEGTCYDFPAPPATPTDSMSMNGHLHTSEEGTSQSESEDQGITADHDADSDPKAHPVKTRKRSSDSARDVSMETRNSLTSGNSEELLNSMPDAVKTLRYQQLHAQEEIEEKYCLADRKPDYEAMERACARQYCTSLKAFLPDLLACMSTIEVDELMLKFAYEFCSDVCENTKEGEGPAAILNGDGVYLATYSALLFNLKLVHCGYYESEEKSLPTTEQQFVEELLTTGLLVYLSPAWLSEVYQHVIKNNFLVEAGYDALKPAERDELELPLIQVLTDIDGLESRQVGGQLMSSFRDLQDEPEAAQANTTQMSPAAEAGMKFAKRVLAESWEVILDVLSVLLNGKSSCGITGSLQVLLGGKEEGRRAREAICTSLDSLQRAARLACALGLQDRCGAVFQQLANASCVMEDLKREEPKKIGKAPTLPGSSKQKLARLHTAHALSMDLIMSIGLEMGSHSGDCWRHVFRCCAHVSELEHTYFSGGLNQAGLPKVQQETPSQPYDLTMDELDPDEPEMYSTMMVAMEPVAPQISVGDVIQQSAEEAGWDSAITGGVLLSPGQTAKVLCGLSQQVDRLFEDASSKLNMKALVSYITELCASSRQQLAHYGHHGHSQNPMPTNVLHLYRLNDIMLHILRSGRPLLHLMRLWSVVAPHLVEAACHRDHNISKKAVNCMHEFVTTLLGLHQELPHSSFNESLCKPLENLLCLELCDGDIQDQVVCSICELVEACASEIKSGWRPLFGALRAVKIEYTTNEEVNEARQRHVAAVLDVFEVFLNTDNILVFANAAVDCILCLLKYVRGRGEFEELHEDNDSDSGSELGGSASEDLCLPALGYLQKCCSILSSMWEMPACPVFNGAHRIQTSCVPKCVDPVIPNLDLESFQKTFLSYGQTPSAKSSPAKKAACAKPTEEGQQNDTGAMGEPVLNSKTNSVESIVHSEASQDNPDRRKQSVSDNTLDLQSLTTTMDSGISLVNADNLSQKDDAVINMPEGEEVPEPLDAQKVLPGEDLLSSFLPQSLEELDNHTGILHVWFLVLEGLASTVSTCPKNYQPQTLETMFELLRQAAQVPGADFSLHCVNHLLLPMLQAWLRRGNQLTGYWDMTLTNFKQCCGLCTDLVVEFTVQFAALPEWQENVEFMLGQILMVLTEAMAQANESLSRLGCACTRHLLLSTGPMLTERMWHIAVRALRHAMDVTVYCLQQLMTPFDAFSDNFYGDIGHVKVGVRKDCTGIEAERLRQLAQQVFLLDSQRGTSHMIDYDAEEARSYVFLIYPPMGPYASYPESVMARVPFRSLVVGLLAHQILVQTVGCLLLQGSPRMVALERNMIPPSTTEGSTDRGSTKDLLVENPPPGMLQYLSARNSLILLQCLESSYKTASEFDLRPGLKFLIQKVAHADVAANMYKQAGVSMLFLMHSLIEICIHQENLCVNNTHLMLSEGQPAMMMSAEGQRSTEALKSQDGDAKSDDETSSIASSKEGSVVSHAAPKAKPDPDYDRALCSSAPHEKFMALFVRKLKRTFDDVCTVYIDMYLDSEGPNKADELSKQVLVFLLADEEVPQLKREKKISEIVAEKIAKMRTPRPSVSSIDTQLHSVQGEDYEGSLDDETASTVTYMSVTSEPYSHYYSQSMHSSMHSSMSNVGDDKVYTVATDRTIKSVVSEYKKHKQQYTMPSFIKATRSKPRPRRKSRLHIDDPTENKIDDEQKASITKDSDAQLQSWIEMLCNVLRLFHQLDDTAFRALLPAMFHCANQLVCQCKDGMLRETLGHWLHRVGELYSIAPPNNHPPPMLQKGC